jgi:glutamine---fructose-6-phosphate transaminase (isomerizing)
MSALGASNSGHTHREILSQPDLWPLSASELHASAAFPAAAKHIASARELVFFGCGTSFYLAEAAASAWTLLTGRPARALPASELLLFPKIVRLHDTPLCAVVISRSGRTSEALRAAEILVKTHGVATIGITCAAGSEITRICPTCLVLPAADEKSMVMTRSFTSMLLALIQVQVAAAKLPSFDPAIHTISAALGAQLRNLDAQIESFVASNSFDDYIYLAQGPFFPIAREAALKVTEMSCSYAQAYHTLEFRHGPKSIVSPKTLLGFLLSDSAMQAESEVLAEMKELGGVILAICNRANDTVRRHSDFVFELKADAPEVALLAPFTVAAQLLGFHTGLKKGFNPDEPKNLSRVVILN